jgi:hypothetical protein
MKTPGIRQGQSSSEVHAPRCGQNRLSKLTRNRRPERPPRDEAVKSPDPGDEGMRGAESLFDWQAFHMPVGEVWWEKKPITIA